MRYVREHINERFTKDSDPIKDLGIGVEEYLNRYLKTIGFNDPANYVFGHLKGYEAIVCKLCRAKDTEKVKKILEIKPNINVKEYHSLCLRWAVTTGDIELMELLINHGASIEDNDAGDSLSVAITWKQEKVIKYLISIGKKITETHISDAKNFYPEIKKYLLSVQHKQQNDTSLDEAFTADSDPISDLGIGSKVIIKKWLHEHRDTIKCDNYKIDKYGRIIVKGNLKIIDLRENLPEYINFYKVSGCLRIYSCVLTTLRGFPEYVGGYVTIESVQKLKNLEYGPKKIMMNSINDYNWGYYVYQNPDLISTKGIPKKVKNFLQIQYNPKLIMDYWPEKITGHFIFKDNKHKMKKSNIPSTCKITDYTSF